MPRKRRLNCWFGKTQEKVSSFRGDGTLKAKMTMGLFGSVMVLILSAFDLGLYPHRKT